MKNIKCIELSLYSVIFTFIVLKDKNTKTRFTFKIRYLKKKVLANLYSIEKQWYPYQFIM